VARALELEELIEHFTLSTDERELLRNKAGATRLGFAVILTFLLWKGRFPRGRSEAADQAVAFVAQPDYPNLDRRLALATAEPPGIPDQGGLA
jgi:hypothetical protein